jgi:multidrug efflux pump subunit AcrB
VNDAIVFLDRYNDLIIEGMSIREAVMEAAISRFRPILLTSLTTVAGLLPLIAEKSMQAQFLIPTAASIAFGILFGTIFILMFYPSAILFWNGYRRLKRYLWTGTWPTDTLDVEPAVRLAKKDQKSEVFN